MTTVLSPNVRNIAIQGSFDDCQDLVKAMFADAPFRDEMHLAAVNSINWGRIMAQIVYYVAAALALGAPERRVAFAVPTGNFGNVYAGYAARAMGLPIEKLIVGSNSNDILTRFIAGGAMKIGAVAPHIKPQHGHPGFEQCGAAAVRSLRARRRRGWRAAMQQLPRRPGDSPSIRPSSTAPERSLRRPSAGRRGDACRRWRLSIARPAS